MKSILHSLLMALMLLVASQTMTAQERRPIDSQHPLWLVHIDVWNSADPQKIIDLIPDDVKPYVCMNLSLSCQFDEKTEMYRMPRYAVRTYKSWATVCQANGMWFTCQPASGGHTHIQDDDLATFEYFFKNYPNFLGWNYAEQFWGFDVAGNKSSSTPANRWALFAKLVEMSHKYGGFLTVSWCGGTYHMNTNPIAELKRNKDFMAACQKYPEAILFLYKYTHAGCFYNNESVCWGPFISGLTKNYGVRYDNCGWNDTLNKLLGDKHGKKYPGSAGIGTVMEQTCVNGGAVWDGPELIWNGECFQGTSDSQIDGYTRRNWTTFPNFRGIWLDMWRKIIDGTMYIPTREEVLEKTKIVVINDKADDYTAWDDLYNGLYLQTDPFNQKKEWQWNYGQWYNNLCYFKSTGRYGAVPIVTGLYDDLAKKIPVQVKKSNYTSRWSTQTRKVADFNAQYPEVSTGDLYVNRYKNQLVTYTPYTYMNEKKTASAQIPLQYNTCESLELTWGKLSSGVIREYSDHIDFYLNNYRNDTTTQVLDKIVVKGATAEPTYSVSKRTLANHTTTKEWDAETGTFTLNVKHLGALDVTINCAGAATERSTDVVNSAPLTADLPKQPEDYTGEIIIEAENMDRKDVGSVALTHSGWWAQNVKDFAAMGYIDLGTKTTASLRHQLKLKKAGDYDIYVRYCNSTKAGKVRLTVNGKATLVDFEKTKLNDWRLAKVSATLKEGSNNFILLNTGGVGMYIDQIIYMPVGANPKKYDIAVREAENGKVEADLSEAMEGETVTLTITPNPGCELKELRVVNSVYFTEGKTIPVEDPKAETITFAMFDDNVTLQPVFVDNSSVYKLDFDQVLNGTMPVGWRATQENNDVHQYPSNYGSGARTFAGFTGYQGKALYWRNTNAEYGKQAAYPLKLAVGDYKLTFAQAAWKGAPQYKVQILNASGRVIAQSATYTATPDANGNTTANLTNAKTYELPFSITTEGNYTVRFVNMTTGGTFQEFLLLECRINTVYKEEPNAIGGIAAQHKPAGIYSPMGVKLNSLQKGLNIIRDADGKTRKVLVK